MDNSKEIIQMRYLGELVRAQLENRMPAAIPDTVSFEELEQIAYSAQMPYMILGALIRLSLSKEQVIRCRNALKTSTLKTLLQVQTVRDIQDRLEKAGIRNQVLKGAVMKYMYPRVELREMSDIDFMIYEKDFTDTERILEEAGFHRSQAIKHHVIYQKPPLLTVEMHWDLYEKTVDKSQYLYYKDQFRAVLAQGKNYTYEFSKENFYVYMISHMAKHFYENGCGIRNLVDIYVFNQKYGNIIDRSLVEQELAKCGILHFESHIAKLAKLWLEDGECTEFYANLFRYMVDCGIYGKGENGIWGQLCKQNTWKHKKRMNLTYYFPTAQYMKEYYPWLEGKEILLPTAWLCRGVHGLFHKDCVERAKKLKDREKYRIMMEIYHNLELNFVK